jgi:hypothetical protein
MVRALLIRGMLVGLLAGLFVFGFGKVFGEPQVDRAISFEGALDEANAKAGEARGLHVVEEPELVSRRLQARLAHWRCGVFHRVWRAVCAGLRGRGSPCGRSAPSRCVCVAGGIGFIAVYLMPNLKYPANPPAVGDPDTIRQRTAVYFIMLAFSVAAMVGAAGLRKRLVERLGEWNAALTAAGGYLITVIVAGRVPSCGSMAVPGCVFRNTADHVGYRRQERLRIVTLVCGY